MPADGRGGIEARAGVLQPIDPHRRGRGAATTFSCCSLLPGSRRGGVGIPPTRPTDPLFRRATQGGSAFPPRYYLREASSRSLPAAIASWWSRCSARRQPAPKPGRLIIALGAHRPEAPGAGRTATHPSLNPILRPISPRRRSSSRSFSGRAGHAADYRRAQPHAIQAGAAFRSPLQMETGRSTSSAICPSCRGLDEANFTSTSTPAACSSTRPLEARPRLLNGFQGDRGRLSIAHFRMKRRQIPSWS